MINHIGAETTPNYRSDGSSGESWTICLRMIQQYQRNDDNSRNCKVLHNKGKN